jgi:hypothetical protein
VDANEYLKCQFGQLAHEYPSERMSMIKGYIKGAASIWLTAALQTDPSQTWEELQGPFIEFIRGGRESRSLWLEKMKGLIYGKGKCKDLLGLEQEFEQLRIKLYPTSSTDPAMNEVVGREYAEAIRRGDISLYREMLRILGGKERITLSEWKSAAVSALKICTLTGTSQRHNAGNNGQQPQRWGQNRFGPLSVQEMDSATGSGSEGYINDKTESQPGATEEAHQMQGKKTAFSGFRRVPFLKLPADEYKIVVEKNLCWQCYQPDHHIGDPACKEKGKPKRRPTKAELNL